MSLAKAIRDLMMSDTPSMNITTMMPPRFPKQTNGASEVSNDIIGSGVLSMSQRVTMQAGQVVKSGRYLLVSVAWVFKRLARRTDRVTPFQAPRGARCVFPKLVVRGEGALRGAELGDVAEDSADIQEIGSVAAKGRTSTCC